MEIRVFPTPDTIHTGDLDGCAAVVIDALRMTSTAAAAVANGCVGLRAVQGVDEARACAAKTGALLGGERNALAIEGFDFGNSPLEYTAERIGGHRLVMTTTNGTMAIQSALSAGRLLLGAFVNAVSVAEATLSAERMAIICAGTRGAFSLEDALAAGAIIHRLKRLGAQISLDDMALASLTLYKRAAGDLHRSLLPARHYNRLKEIGLQRDLDFCLSEDTLRAVPEMGEDGWFV